MSQETLEYENDSQYYYVFYREIQSRSNKLENKKFDKKDKNSISRLLNDIFGNKGGEHHLKELDTSSYFNRWINKTINTSKNIVPGEDISERQNEILKNIAENFSENMKTSARAEGKYIIMILGEGQLITCHSYTGKKALTTDMDVVEELLSSDNIDKYAEFTEDEDGILVNHFDRHNTDSFSGWLGIPKSEIIYDINGDVKVHSKINGSLRTTIKFSKKDVVEKIINSDSFQMEGSVLRTPEGSSDYRISHIGWGNKIYQNPEEFKQEVLTHHYELSYYENEYECLQEGDLELATKEAIDRENKLTLIHKNKKETKVTKETNNFNIVLANEYIELEAGWVSSLATQAFDHEERVPIYHPGNSIKDNPIHIGNLKIYNKIGVKEETTESLRNLVKTAQDLGTGNMSSLVKYIIFNILGKVASKPISHFFVQMSEEYLKRHESTVSDGSTVTFSEGGSASVELKSAEWFYVDNDKKLVNKMVDELDNGAGLIVGGVDENGGRVKGIQKNRFPHERLNGLQEKAESRCDAEAVHVVPVPVSDKDITITATKIA